MNIMNLFRKKEYPAIVQEIHNEFLSSDEKALAKAKEILNSSTLVDNEKAKRLKKAGFVLVPQVQETEKEIAKIEKTKEEIQLIEYYRFNYPFNKFVTNDQIKSICHKYGLVYGDVSLFKGFVPEKNLTDIENFKLKQAEKEIFICSGNAYATSGGGSVSFSIKNAEIKKRQNYFHFYKMGSKDLDDRHAFQSVDGVSFYANDNYDIFGLNHLGNIKFTIDSPSFKICAPLKDMNMDKKQIKDGYLIKDYPDPIVIQPVHGGGLIVTMWGDEQFDPFSEKELINEVNN